ncbi:MAG: hypothetical protein CMK72_08725 [Pseudomonadaceae bacterium]|nr:hypothetical protein [Pseudomonadaceae bacterium]HCP54145.1 hypothetical protein [Pseudomonas sp.]
MARVAGQARLIDTPRGRAKPALMVFRHGGASLGFGQPKRTLRVVIQGLMALESWYYQLL